ncbi:MAG: hypothetical protein H0W48_09910 [Methylibium sp.]|uniref:hypothetical protein n=1 Tax=Methylibium sp. TaxID=2067992 RepID=UPI00184A7550|nr:hypothetical protein [Methylibium sp.]MBA3588789.1 hypothetical protein [Methylibium sp.]MBA3624744.1 hypothetical protein [Methylibium sp.]
MKGLTIGRSLGAAVFAVAALGLAGCGEEPQQGTQTERKVDTQAWDGAQAKFTADGWKAGDRASWERQLKERSQRQNEYVRIR